MGGIAAAFVFKNDHADVGLTRDMLAAASALGGDGNTDWSDGPVSLGVNHSIRTPEDRLGLPLVHDAGRAISIAADVRLDNRAELIRTLDLPAQPPHDVAPARVMTDAQLVLACYRQWGCDAFSRLCGQFAVTIWDGRRRRLVCARDALGRRPLFWHRNDRRLVCASSIRQLFCDPTLRAKLNQDAVGAFLVGVQLPANATFFQGIQRLPAGSWLQADDDGTVQIQRYWNPESIAQQRGRSVADWSDEFRDRFRDSVSACLRSTSGTVGLHVSGGLDSTAVVGMVHHLNATESLNLQPVAFQCLADRPEADERSYMDAVLARYPMPVETNRSADYWGFKQHAGMQLLSDEPFQTAYIARGFDELARADQLGIRVVLGGDVGDELGGSSWYLVDRLLRGRIIGLPAELRARARGRERSSLSLLRALASRFARHLLGRNSKRPPSWMASDFYRRWSETWVRPKRTFWNPARDDVFFRLSYCWTEPSITAAYVALNSSGVELRSPFLDQRLFEWAFAIPPALLGAQGCVKTPFRIGLDDLLPEKIKTRATKGNYRYYLDLGLKVKERRRIESMLASPRLAELGFVDAQDLQRCYQRYAGGGPIDRGHLWNVLTLESWLRTCPLL